MWGSIAQRASSPRPSIMMIATMGHTSARMGVSAHTRRGPVLGRIDRQPVFGGENSLKQDNVRMLQECRGVITTAIVKASGNGEPLLMLRSCSRDDVTIQDKGGWIGGTLRWSPRRSRCGDSQNFANTNRREGMQACQIDTHRTRGNPIVHQNDDRRSIWALKGSDVPQTETSEPASAKQDSNHRRKR